jgi:ABC-type uncharacterized transport system permease subunit
MALAGFQGAEQASVAFFAVIAAFCLGAIALLATGANPLAAYSALLEGAFGSAQSLSTTAMQATPLLLASLAVSLSFRAGVFNIGAGGQLGVGALASAVIGAYVRAGPGIELAVMAAGATAAGALWAAIAGVLKAFTGASEVITTLMLNYVAANLIDYTVTGPAKAPGDINQTPQLSGAALFPSLASHTQLTAAVFVAIVAAVFAWVLLWRTGFGFRLRMVGLNPDAAKAAGLSVKRVVVAVLVLSGSLAGLGGMTEVAGLVGSVPQNFSLQVGFDAIAVALLGRNGVAGTVLASVLLGGLISGSTTMEARVGVSGPFVEFLEAIMIAAIVLMPMAARSWSVRRQSRPAFSRRLRGRVRDGSGRASTGKVAGP